MNSVNTKLQIGDTSATTLPMRKGYQRFHAVFSAATVKIDSG